MRLNFLALLTLAISALSHPLSDDDLTLAARDASNSSVAFDNEKLVFAHFMIGIMSNRHDPSPYDLDMQLAKASGIDAFALNIGVDPYTDEQLNLAYQSANNNGMKAFISFDFNWYHPDNAGAVASKIIQYANQPAQLLYNGKIFVSSFAGDGLNVAEIRNQVQGATGKDIFFVPNFHPTNQAGGVGFDQLDGALNWMAWRNNGNNKAPGSRTVTVAQGDQDYINGLAGKPYLAPVSGWFFTHFGPEVPYSKNWVFPGDLLLYQRWVDILASQPRFIELVTWNDYGESHYFGPLRSRHTDDGASKWVNDMPHTGWLTMSKPFIDAYKAGQTTLNPSVVKEDKLIYWYRPHLRELNCDSTDTTMTDANNSSGNYFKGRPDGYLSLTDTISLVAFLTSPGVVIINSGGTIYTSSQLPAGVSALSVPFKVGAQSFSLSRNGNQVLSATSLKEIKAECPCGIYNFNPYVGTVPPEAADPLGGDGFGMFSGGLKVACAPQPSLPATPPQTAAATQTVTVSPVSTGTKA